MEGVWWCWMCQTWMFPINVNNFYVTFALNQTSGEIKAGVRERERERGRERSRLYCLTAGVSGVINWSVDVPPLFSPPPQCTCSLAALRTGRSPPPPPPPPHPPPPPLLLFFFSSSVCACEVVCVVCGGAEGCADSRIWLQSRGPGRTRDGADSLIKSVPLELKWALLLSGSPPPHSAAFSAQDLFYVTPAGDAGWLLPYRWWFCALW